MMNPYFSYGIDICQGPSLFGMVFHALGWVVGILIIIWIVRLLTGKSHKSWSPFHDRSQTILRERYAKGEVTKEEFESMKKDLE